jgi:PAS domain S-box-containing protein
MAAESVLKVLELFPGPALIIEPGGKIVGVNQRTEQWLGLGRDELLGPLLAQFVAESPEQVAGFLEDCARGGRKTVGTFTALQGDRAGQECHVEGISVPSGSDGDEHPMVVVHVVPREPCGDGIATATDPGGTLEALWEERRRNDQFLGQVAHDLRNPVAVIRSALHLVRTASSRQDVAWAEDAMDRQVDYLVRQIDDLLDFSRITRGKIELKRQHVDATALARAAVAKVRPLIDEHNLEFILATSPGELAVDADPPRLEQMLVSLLGHAARTTEPQGHIRLSVARERDTIVFQVQSRGEDIPAAMLSLGVELPTPVDSSEHAQSIGLMLVRKLAELHGGSATIRSKGSGAGSEVAIRLPAASNLPESTVEPVADTSPVAPAGARVLIVDDNVDTAKSTGRLLQLDGHDVRVAHDGREALEMAHAFHPRYVLLDIGLPVMDGYEVARQLRGDPQLRNAVIIAVSGYSVDDYRPPHEAGFDHHLVKPVDYDTLRAILNQPT